MVCGIYIFTYCQKVSGSPSRRHSTPNPNLLDETDHLAREEISGQGKSDRCVSPIASVNDQVTSVDKMNRYLPE